jgi:hypothetical protein
MIQVRKAKYESKNEQDHRDSSAGGGSIGACGNGAGEGIGKRWREQAIAAGGSFSWKAGSGDELRGVHGHAGYSPEPRGAGRRRSRPYQQE